MNLFFLLRRKNEKDGELMMKVLLVVFISVSIFSANISAAYALNYALPAVATEIKNSDQNFVLEFDDYVSLSRINFSRNFTEEKFLYLNENVFLKQTLENFLYLGPVVIDDFDWAKEREEFINQQEFLKAI